MKTARYGHGSVTNSIDNARAVSIAHWT